MLTQSYPSRTALLGVALALTGFVTGCKEESIRAYQVPKEQPREQARAQSSPHGTDRPTAPKAHVHWESLPPNWQDRPVSGVMRAAEFGIRGEDGQTAELAVLALPEVRGMELEFVNMWREQISLGTTTLADIANLREEVTIAGSPGQLFDMVGEPPADAGQVRPRTIVAMYSVEGTTWFFKLTGPDALVAGQKDHLKSFLENVDLHTEPHGDPHAGMATAPTTPPAGKPPGLPNWTVPAGWTQIAPGPMLLASFDLAGGAAKVTVSSLGGDGGGLLPNINRWRNQQLGLSPLDESELTGVVAAIQSTVGAASLVDLTNQTQRMLVVIVPHQGRSWFYKLLGDTTAVTATKDAFLQFAQTAQY